MGAVSFGHKAGKRVRRKVTGRTKTEVRVKLRQLRREVNSGVRSSATYSVSDALDDWLATGLSGRSGRTAELYRDTVKPLRDRLGETKLRELTAGDVQEALEALAERFSTRSLQIIRICLERAIRHAESPRSGRPERGGSGPDAQGKVWPAVQEPDTGAGAGAAAGGCGSRLYAYVVLSVTTGLRTEELRALRWNKVDLNAGTVAVYRAVRASGDTKTPSRAGASCCCRSWRWGTAGASQAPGG